MQRTNSLDSLNKLPALDDGKFGDKYVSNFKYLNLLIVDKIL